MTTSRVGGFETDSASACPEEPTEEASRRASSSSTTGDAVEATVRPEPSHTSGDAIATHGLTKRFRHQLAVDGIDLRVPTGAVYGFLGPNGSGKTTTIRMLLGLIGPTAGTVELLGEPIPEGAARALSRVGSLVEGPAFHPYLSGRANLHRLDAADSSADPATSRARVDAALDRVGLLAAGNKRFRAYSLGMRQRLAIAAALLMPRDLLVLDEPTNGLDPQGTREVRTLVGSLASDGTTVLVSSHLLSEVEQLCSHIGVMHAGHLVAQGTAADLRRGTDVQARVDTERPDAAARVMRELGLSDVQAHANAAIGRLGDVAPERLVAACVNAGVPVVGFTVDAPSLEDVFVSLTGEGFDVSG
ncbi:MAG TPA: ABC transporter ATP-binding protein [Nocardioidaceae bacterium]|nr:ABC transporter ATP-binding protein [Nocardioidaceae bacterium]